jgi:hypothetical protein
MIAAAHFVSELVVFRTVKINRASIWPLLIGSTSDRTSDHIVIGGKELMR